MIKNGTIISNKCTIITYNHNYKDSLFAPYGLDNIYKDVVIEKNVWIGINVNIAPGVTINKNSIIGMGTTVTKSIPEGIIYGGNKIIADRSICNFKYNLLSVRTIYNPFNYIKFKFVIGKMKNKINNKKCIKTITFDDIKNKYKKSDYLSLIYRYSQNNGCKIDWKKSVININRKEFKEL